MRDDIYVQKVKGQPHCDVIMFCGEIVTIFNIWLETELVTVIFGVHFEPEVVFFRSSVLPV